MHTNNNKNMESRLCNRGKQGMGRKCASATDDDVVDRDVNELHEEADEAHDRETDGGRDRDLLVLCKTSDWNCSEFPRLPFRSGFVQRFTRRMESFMNCLLGSTNACTCSIALNMEWIKRHKHEITTRQTRKTRVVGERRMADRDQTTRA
jgi:hypothetical protein